MLYPWNSCGVILYLLAQGTKLFAMMVDYVILVMMKKLQDNSMAKTNLRAQLVLSTCPHYQDRV